MKKITNLKLHQLNRVEMEKREMQHVLGGDCGCSCACAGSASTSSNAGANLGYGIDAAHCYGSGSGYCWNMATFTWNPNAVC